MSLSHLWRDASILTKVAIVLGALLGVLWITVFLNVFQLRSLTNESSRIMRQYGEITGFIDALSTESRCLEAYVRPSHTPEDESAYLEAVADTDHCVQALMPDLRADERREYMLKRAITNAMEHYRGDQTAFMQSGDQRARVQWYVTLERQAVYLNQYGVELLNCRMEAGERRWADIAQANRRSVRTIFAFMIAATVVTVLGLHVLMRTMLRPIVKLGAAADAISRGDYDGAPLDEASGDEIGRLARSFNVMQRGIKDTITTMEREAEIEKENARMQEAMQESRYAELQSQIDPHFLFNTLNAIAALANEEGAPITEDLILRMAKIFRYSLENREKRVTLGQELQYLGDYMELMDARFAGRISMHIEPFDPALLTRAVPKFTLQTIAENSIIHGFQDITQGGEIVVRISEDEEGRLLIEMSDNGCGFDVAKLKEEGAHRSVGLANIQERLHYIGGRMDIDSVIGVGTTITISIDKGEGK
ncbi:MAG: HAMP domain-containing protein [Clostridiales bacterium]|nr:HAMP domain-containing protein [Clostridiales bacterium]